MKHETTGGGKLPEDSQKKIRPKPAGDRKTTGLQGPGRGVAPRQSTSIPPLMTALAYELIFRVPTAAIFGGMHETIWRNIEKRLQEMEAALENRDAADPDANLVAHKLVWLNERKSG